MSMSAQRQCEENPNPARFRPAKKRNSLGRVLSLFRGEAFRTVLRGVHGKDLPDETMKITAGGAADKLVSPLYD